MGKRVAIDTNIFIYAIEDQTVLGRKARQVLDQVKLQKIEAFTSVLTIEEIMVKVFKEGGEAKIPLYLEYISGAGLITIREITKTVALQAAKLRAKYNLRTPDALQLATAIVCKVDTFITADKHFPKNIIEIRIEVLD